MRKIQNALVATAALAALSSASSLFASTGNFTAPLTTGVVLSVDINGGIVASNTPTNEGYSSSLGTSVPDPFGVLWSPWGGPTGFGGDGTQLPDSQASPVVTASSITKTFGAVGVTVNESGTPASYAQGGGGPTLNSRDRGGAGGAPARSDTADNNVFLDLLFAGASGSNVQGSNYAQVQLTGLTPLTQYAIALYSYDPTGSHSTNWTATAPTISNSISGYWAASPVGNNTFAAPADEQTITWSNATSPTPTPAPAVLIVTTDATGAASVYGFGGNGVSGNASADTTYLNGLQISTVVPEPASMSVLGLAAVGLLGRRNRKNV